jgi:hypothetical protein
MVLRAVAVGLVSVFVVPALGCVPNRPPAQPSVIFVESVSGGAPVPVHDEPGARSVSWEAKEEVEVEWHGSWWPAVVLEKRGHRFLVRYDGYGAEWDEMVESERVRERHILPALEPDDLIDDVPDP